MGKITKLEDLEVYQESLKLTTVVFKLCKNNSIKREFSLCNQLKRASISVSANIAEGYGRRTKADFAHFLSVALGSANETIALIDIIQLNFKGIKVAPIRQRYKVLSKRIYTFRRTIS